MQEGRKCIFVILQEKQFCAQISFVFYCFWHLISSIIMQILWAETYTIAQNVPFYFNIQYVCEKLNFTQNVTYDLLAFTWRIEHA